MFSIYVLSSECSVCNVLICRLATLAGPGHSVPRNVNMLYCSIEKQIKTTPGIIGACDREVKSFPSIIYSVASFSFGPSSHILGSTGVTQSIDSTHSELVAIFDLLSQAVLNNLDKLCIVIDNQSAMAIAAAALTSTSYDSIYL